MDYQKLLSAYIQYILDEESIHFLECAYKVGELDEDELTELKRIADEIAEGN